MEATLDRIEEETRNYLLLPITAAELIEHEVEFVGDPDEPFWITVGVELNADDLGSVQQFIEIERGERDCREYALPHFEQRYTAMYRGRIERAANGQRLWKLARERVAGLFEWLSAEASQLEEAVTA